MINESQTTKNPNTLEQLSFDIECAIRAVSKECKRFRKSESNIYKLQKVVNNAVDVHKEYIVEKRRSPEGLPITEEILTEIQRGAIK